MAEDLLEGDVVAGRYRLDHLLGEGGMGSVWAATHLVTRKAVAVKFLLGSLNARHDMRERFLREARAATAVDHPNVVEIFDVFELDDGTPVMVMALLRGETLEQRLERDRKIPLANLVEIMVPVVSAVGTAHSRGIVHRDLKPDNVFLATEGTREVVKVLDFGIAKLLARDEPTTGGGKQVTAAGTMLGTLCYMSPEQAFGERDVDHRADVWAVGVMLYKALSGVLPVEGEHIGQVMKSLMMKEIEPIDSLVPSLPADVASLVMRMLARERDGRPADLREVHETLSRHTSVSAPGFGAPEIAPVASDAPPPIEESRRRHASSGSIRRTGKTVDPGARTLVADQASTTGSHAISVVGTRTRNWTIVGLGLGAVVIGFVGWRLGRSTPVEPAITAGSVLVPAVAERAPARTTAAATEAPSAVPAPAASAGVVPVASAASSSAAVIEKGVGLKGKPRPSPAPSSGKRPESTASPAPRSTTGLHEEIPF